ncbi:MAG: protein kinase family protein [Clostridiaceae bacterium]|nr:protein kinase family protein [Clostridiaceae bacterium]
MEIPQLSHGIIIEGKWKKNRYKIKKKIGEGGIGAVYLVKDLNTETDYAMKISKDSLSLNREYQLLKNFYKIDIIVSVYELDDCVVNGENFYYILLEYVNGIDLKRYIGRNKLDKNMVLGIILIILKGLQALHEEEYIMADLKLENIMLDRQHRKIKMIDLGGITPKGRGIKEFTPLYDRGSWRCGNRIAEESYDVFAAMIVLSKLLVNEEINPRRQRIKDIVYMLKREEVEEQLIDCVHKGLTGQETSLQYFISRFKRLYTLERINNKQKRILLRNRKIDIVFVGSIFLFLGMVTLIIAR